MLNNDTTFCTRKTIHHGGCFATIELNFTIKPEYIINSSKFNTINYYLTKINAVSIINTYFKTYFTQKIIPKS